MRKNLKFLVFCLLALAVLVWFGWNLDWAEAAESIRRADWRLVAAAVCFVWLTYLIRAFRWRTLLAPLAPRASLREAFAATTVGFSAIFLVGRAVGEVLRPAYLALRDPEVKTGPAFVTIAVERVFDMSAVVLLFAANLIILRLPGADEATAARVREAGLLLLACAAAGLAVLAYARRHAEAASGWLEVRLARAPAAAGRAGRVLAGLLVQTARTLDVLAGGRALALTVGWTAALWAAITAANLLVLRAFGLPVGVSETVFVLGWSLVGSLVPTPGGGAGTYHLATAYGLILVLGGGEQTANVAKAAVIVLNLVVFGSALFFGVYYFLRSGVGLARLRGLAAGDGAAVRDGHVGAGTPDERAGREVARGARA
ncbi:MAG TPA: lysylphosphatidylglycerol synthase transmembrane domain-containing protein [Pyrinomonadaceae bacterium]|nr:lysylphosphatidylglycerol synthase transmembrane domain-containing protein [Pyrinomonadaceae bacterium]